MKSFQRPPLLGKNNHFFFFFSTFFHTPLYWYLLRLLALAHGFLASEVLPQSFFFGRNPNNPHASSFSWNCPWGQRALFDSLPFFIFFTRIGSLQCESPFRRFCFPSLDLSLLQGLPGGPFDSGGYPFRVLVNIPTFFSVVVLWFEMGDFLCKGHHGFFFLAR